MSEIDVLHIALGCRFALVIFTISQQLSPTPDHEPLPHDPEFANTFEHGCYTCLLTITLANLLVPWSWKGTHTLSLTLCGRNPWLHSVNSRNVDLHRSCTARFVRLQFPPTTARTHCHFVMQARALRVPELCDDHNPSIMLGCVPTCEAGASVCEHVGAPDPLLTQGGPVTFPACALYQLFVRSCVLAHHGLYCSHVCACTHHSSLQHLSLVFAFVSSQMEEQQNVLPPLGTTEWNHSYYTGNSLSAPHSLEQLQAGCELHVCAATGLHTGVQRHSVLRLCVQPTVTTQCHHLTKLLRAPLAMSQGEVMSTSLAEAVTQLSFFEFLQRCNLLIAAPPPPPQPPVPTSVCRYADSSTQRCLSGRFYATLVQ